MGIKLIVAAAMLPVPAADAAADGYIVEDRLSQSFEAPITPRIIVETFNGDIEVTGEPSRTVKAEVTRHGTGNSPADAEAELGTVQVTMDQEGNMIRIIARRMETQPGENSGASIKLTVPARATVDSVSRNGSVVVSGVGGGARVVSSNGGITVTGGRGRLVLQTGNGPIRIEARDAVVNAGTSNGRIDFTGTLAEGNQFFHTGNGPIEITLPPDARFKINASSWNGKVSSGFRVSRTGGSGDIVLNGNVGDNPKIVIKAEAVNGDVVLRRAQ